MVPVIPRSRSAVASCSICKRVADGISTVHAQDGSGRAATAGSAWRLVAGRGAGGVERRAKVERAEQLSLGDLVVGHGVALRLERVPVAHDGGDLLLEGLLRLDLAEGLVEPLVVVQALVGHDRREEFGELPVVGLECGPRARLAPLLRLVELRLDAVRRAVDDGRDLLAALLEGGERLVVLALHGLSALLYLGLEPVEVGAVVLGLLDLVGLGEVVGRALIELDGLAHALLEGVEVRLD